MSHGNGHRHPRNFLLDHAPQFGVKFGDGKSNRVKHIAEWIGTDHKMDNGLTPYAFMEYDVEHHDNCLNINLDETIKSVKCVDQTSQSLTLHFSKQQDLENFERSLVVHSTKLVGHCDDKQMFYRLVTDYDINLTGKKIEIYTRHLSLVHLFKNANVKFHSNAAHLLGSYSENVEMAPSSLSATTPATLVRRQRSIFSSIGNAFKSLVKTVVTVVKQVVTSVVDLGLKALGLYNTDIQKTGTIGMAITGKLGINLILKAEASGSYSYSNSYTPKGLSTTLGSFSFVIVIIPINIQLDAALSITFGLEFNIAASVTTGLSYSKSAKLGLQYTGGKIGSYSQFDPATQEFHKPSVSVELTSSIQLGFEVSFTVTLEFVLTGTLGLTPYLTYDISVQQNSQNKSQYDATGVLSIHFDITVQGTLGIMIKGVAIGPKLTSPTYTLYAFTQQLLSISHYIGSGPPSPQITSTLVPVKGSSADSGSMLYSLFNACFRSFLRL
ncbi:unnamed protein product [Didymodactylos carnosus]|uniref:Uncharacterized protein n=1 Tax=Didymodactylos carnosus TaxID=1234261 RepID=A0A8S2QS97_9BILA|nr:unnamed protein product [Didymodactylos carnosus]CAF4115534.1 unnamed protein product [Didymodactylos carnosus]